MGNLGGNVVSNLVIGDLDTYGDDMGILQESGHNVVSNFVLGDMGMLQYGGNSANVGTSGGTANIAGGNADATANVGNIGLGSGGNSFTDQTSGGTANIAGGNANSNVNIGSIGMLQGDNVVSNLVIGDLDTYGDDMGILQESGHNTVSNF